MANMNWDIKSVQKGGAASSSNYIWGRDDFNYKDEVVATGCGNLPYWCDEDPQVFFLNSDLYERKGGAAARHLTVSLPRELELHEWIALVEALIARDIGCKPYQYAIHLPHRDDDENAHPHAHILYSDRLPDDVERTEETFFCRPNPTAPERGGCKKDTGGKSRRHMGALAAERRKVWAELQNSALAAGGHDARVDHRPKKRAQQTALR